MLQNIFLNLHFGIHKRYSLTIDKMAYYFYKRHIHLIKKNYNRHKNIGGYIKYLEFLNSNYYPNFNLKGYLLQLKIDLF